MRLFSPMFSCRALALDLIPRRDIFDTPAFFVFLRPASPVSTMSPIAFPLAQLAGSDRRHVKRVWSPSCGMGRLSGL